MSPKSGFLSGMGTAFEIFKAITDAVLGEGGNDDDLRGLIGDRSKLREIAKIILRKKPTVIMMSAFMVNYGQRPFYDKLREQFDWVWSGYDEILGCDLLRSCQEVPDAGSVEVTAELMHYGCPVRTETVLEELDRRGLRPATFEELLSFAKSFPELEYQIVALGSMLLRVGECSAAILDDDVSNGRGLRYDRHERIWWNQMHFLGIRT